MSHQVCAGNFSRKRQKTAHQTPVWGVGGRSEGGGKGLGPVIALPDRMQEHTPPTQAEPRTSGILRRGGGRGAPSPPFPEYHLPHTTKLHPKSETRVLAHLTHPDSLWDPPPWCLSSPLPPGSTEGLWDLKTASGRLQGEREDAVTPKMATGSLPCAVNKNFWIFPVIQLQFGGRISEGRWVGGLDWGTELVPAPTQVWGEKLAGTGVKDEARPTP